MAEKKIYCYQCNQSRYDFFPKNKTGVLCLYCQHKQSYIPKNKEIVNCKGFGNIEVPEEWREIQRLRGTLE